jgi:hypothetical protein
VNRLSKSRRRFIRAVAAGSAVSLVAPLRAIARSAASATGATTPKKAAAPKRAPAAKPRPAADAKHVALPKEVEKLKGYTNDALKAVRAYPLPTGSEMAFTFHPVRPRRATQER